jgi:ribosomal protein S9
MSDTKDKVIRAVGRRKTATAQVVMTPGSGSIIVNGKPVESFFAGLPRFQANVAAPLLAVNCVKLYNITAQVDGGGVMAQSEAIRHGLSRALSSLDAGFKATLKKKGFLTRDSRAVERKKPGKAKARKSFQWTKR